MKTKRIIIRLVLASILTMGAIPVFSQEPAQKDSAKTETVQPQAAETTTDTLAAEETTALDDIAGLNEEEFSLGFHQQLKQKFIDGTPLFMSLVALTLVLGLAFCIERIIYLTLSEVKTRKLLEDIDARVTSNDIEGARQLCRDTRGPVASICYQGLLHANEPTDDIERSMVTYGSVLSANLEKGCTWIKLFIAMAPSLGFLGTVIGMVMAFDQIQTAGDISPTIVASGMKVALITTIFGIIVALILQMFYNYILNKIERLTVQMEESAVTLIDALAKYKSHGR
jgi:biopolymer transport protein ExbB